jgi:ATP-binding cassette, subfamily B, multidrug efflux pump
LEKKGKDLALLGRLIVHTKPYRLIFIISGFLAVVLAPLAILRPKLIQQMVDDHIFNNDLKGIIFLTLILIGLLFLEAILRYIFTYATGWLGESVVKDLRTKVFQHVIDLRLGYFDRTPIGTSTTRTINDIQTINDIFTQGIITIVADLLTLIAVLSVMFITSWKLTLVCLTTLPFLMLASYIFKEKVKVSFQKVRAEIAKMNAFLQERITGMRIVQIFNAEEKEQQKFRTINRRYTQANLDSILYYAVFFPVVEIISAASLGLMVWWGARGVIDNEVTLGALVAFPIYLEMLFRPIRMLADKFNTLQMGLVAAERVFALLDMEEKIPNPGQIKPTQLKGEIEFEKVNFAYQDDDWVLKEVSFKVHPGETLAIVGSTGSGKTTITNILNRFYEIKSGSIRIDGISYEQYDVYALRNRISMVLQDVFLFSGSVFENITLRDPDISLSQVKEAALMIGADEFIQRLPGGYSYEVMERGATLSMGQRQLISFVRALVFNPDILILDEATSSVDPETESVIQFAIERLIAKRTSIIIAHRLSTIKNATNILVMNKGIAVEFGPHDQLLNQPEGYYKKLYESQFNEQASFPLLKTDDLSKF